VDICGLRGKLGNFSAFGSEFLVPLGVICTCLSYL
jgi:hypothetical protein